MFSFIRTSAYFGKFPIQQQSPRVVHISYRSSPSQMVFKISVLKYFAKFTKKHLRQSLIFNKISPEACNLIKKGTLFFLQNFNNVFSDRTLTVAAPVATLHDSYNGIPCSSGPLTFLKIVSSSLVFNPQLPASPQLWQLRIVLRHQKIWRVVRTLMFQILKKT